MKAYKAIEDFKDLKDSSYKYHAGDSFPRKGYKPSAERLEELLSANNKRGRAVIAEVKEEPKEEPVSEPVKEDTAPAEKPKRRRKKNVE